MSNYLAIATVTATLRKLLQSTVQVDIEGARITTVRPDMIGRGTPETGVNIYLYQVTPINWRNADLPTRRTSGEIVKRPQIALDLNYIFTFYGNDSELEPQRLLGSVARTLHARPILLPELIQNTIEDTTFRYLRESDVVEQIEQIKIMSLPLTTEDLSKIWSVFFQTPYSLSIAYRVSTILIESDEIPRVALPVREQRINIISYIPKIEKIISQDQQTKVWSNSTERLIMPSSNIKIQGKSLQSSVTIVRIGLAEASPLEQNEQELTVEMSSFAPSILRAGVQTLQVLHPQREPQRRIVESNLFPFLLIPVLKSIQVIETREASEELWDVSLAISTIPLIGRTQQVILILNEIATEEPKEYSFKLPPRDADREILTAVINPIKRGEYLIRLQVDGVQSILDVDMNSGSPTFEQYVGPRLIIS